MEHLQRVQALVVRYLPNKDLDWWVRLRNVKEIHKHHDTFVYCEVVFYVMALLTFVHAMRHGGRFRWIWFATILHGITVECVSYFLPDIDNFWHAQSMVMLIGQRLPLHIMFLYPAFLYTSSVAVSHMKLRWWAEPFAVGLGVVLLDIPYDIMGIKLLWWTWHDDDPNIYDRNYWAPWTSYYFHATFAAAFTFVFHGVRSLLCRRLQKFQSAGFFTELFAAILAGIFGMPLGVLQFLPIYHPLHDTYGIHSEVCVLMVLAAYALIVWSADRVPYDNARVSSASKNGFTEVALAILIHYGLYIYLVFMAKPETTRAIGLHQPIGPCEKTVEVQTPFGHTLFKRKYLCKDNYSEDYFDFHCIKKIPKDGDWYTACGTKYPNHVEYICIILTSCAIGLFWYWQLLFRSGTMPKTKFKLSKSKQHRD